MFIVSEPFQFFEQNVRKSISLNTKFPINTPIGKDQLKVDIFELKPTSKVEVLKIIKGIRTKAAGHDEIDRNYKINS